MRIRVWYDLAMLINPDNYEVMSCGCWEWNKTYHLNGYPAQRNYNKRPVSPHKIALLERGREIPPHWHVDHLCMNTRCVNPEHLDAVPSKVNGKRRRLANILFGWSTHCNRGHLMDDMNTIWRSNGTGRQCRTCQNVAYQESALRAGKRRKPVDYSPVWTKPHGSIKRKKEYETITQELLDECMSDWAHVVLMKNCNHVVGSSTAISQGKEKSLGYKTWHKLDN